MNEKIRELFENLFRFVGLNEVTGYAILLFLTLILSIYNLRKWNNLSTMERIFNLTILVVTIFVALVLYKYS